MYISKIGVFDAGNVSMNISKMQQQISSSIMKLSSGSGISFSKDSIAATISERLRSEIDEMSISMRNVQDQIGSLELSRSESFIKLDVTHRIRELAIAYKNGTLSDSEKEAIQSQVDELSKILDDDGIGIEKYTSKIKIEENGSVSGLDVQVSITGSFESSNALVIEQVDNPEIELSAIMKSNAKFLKTDSGSISTTLPEIVYGKISQEINKESSFDLSADNAISTIDTRLEGYASAAASATAKINALEYELEALQSNKDAKNEWMDNMSSTDIAGEIENLIKAKMILEVGQNVQKIQHDLEKSMVLTLLA